MSASVTIIIRYAAVNFWILISLAAWLATQLGFVVGGRFVRLAMPVELLDEGEDPGGRGHGNDATNS